MTVPLFIFGHLVALQLEGASVAKLSANKARLLRSRPWIRVRAKDVRPVALGAKRMRILNSVVLVRPVLVSVGARLFRED